VKFSGIAVRIRRLRMHEVSSVANLIMLSLYGIDSKYYPKKVLNYVAGCYSQKNIRKLADSGAREIFVATNGNRIVGTAQLTQDGWVCGLFVHPDCQNCGIGSKLVGRIKKAAKARGLDTLRMHAAINSVGFYKKLGFRIVKPVEHKNAGKTYWMIARL
jgi:ribosomal protein S18 acetylase RimI-like enzyme